MRDTTRVTAAGFVVAMTIVSSGAVAATHQQAVYAGKVPEPVVGHDGSVTRSALDPQALVVVGQPAPDFSTHTADNRLFRLALLRGRANVMMVFCPDQAAAPGCAVRLASLHASRSQLGMLDTEIVVVSEWKGAAPAKSRKQQQGITWVNDQGLRISSCYARRAAGETSPPRPMVVIVDKQGKVVRALDDRSGTSPTTSDLLSAIPRTPSSR